MTSLRMFIRFLDSRKVVVKDILSMISLSLIDSLTSHKASKSRTKRVARILLNLRLRATVLAVGEMDIMDVIRCVLLKMRSAGNAIRLAISNASAIPK